MPLKTETRKLPQDCIELACPKCGGRAREAPAKGLNDCIFQCGVCGMQFEAVIQISWTEEK